MDAENIRIVAGIFVSLCMSRILMDLAKYIQYPKKYKLSYLHVNWLMFFSLSLVDWWWSIFEWGRFFELSYFLYIFFVLNAFSFYFLASLVTPTEFPDHEYFDQYFMGIRKWFYVIFIINMVTSDFDVFFKKYTVYDYISMGIIIIICIFFIFAARSNSRVTQHVISTVALGLQFLIMTLKFF